MFWWLRIFVYGFHQEELKQAGVEGSKRTCAEHVYWGTFNLHRSPTIARETSLRSCVGKIKTVQELRRRLYVALPNETYSNPSFGVAVPYSCPKPVVFVTNEAPTDRRCSANSHKPTNHYQRPPTPYDSTLRLLQRIDTLKQVTEQERVAAKGNHGCRGQRHAKPNPASVLGTIVERRSSLRTPMVTHMLRIKARPHRQGPGFRRSPMAADVSSYN